MEPQGENSNDESNIISFGRRKRPAPNANERRRATSSGTVPDAAAEAAGENLKCAVGENQNSSIRSSGNDKIGRHLPITCNLVQVHDFIEISIHLISQENNEFKAFYEQGHSIQEVADRLGFPFTTVRSHLVRMGVTLRPNKSVSFLGNQRQTFKSGAPPPYGFCYLDGQLQKDPREYPILQIIETQRQLGRTPTEIARILQGRKLKTRHGKIWNQAHVFNIVKKLKNKQITL
ncbi:MAG: hypothetical protein JNM24_05845 [Bdellovibrionaceae bacterium]|nr:hypothetical protein [Pseudobdellovibrionaceae bacterium]